MYIIPKGEVMGDMDFGGWCILRTKSSRTLRLAQSLAEDGYEVWTPAETRTLRIPRMNAKREIRFPIMPSYVFAKAFQLIDLIQLAAMKPKPRRGSGLRQPGHDDFSVMRCPGGIPFVSETSLAALRHLEAKRTPRKKAERSFEGGAQVRVEGGSFGGMAGTVEKGDRSQTLVCFNGRYLVKIPTSILRDVGVGSEQSSSEDGAAQAA